MKPEVEKLMFSVSGGSTSVGSSYSDSDSTMEMVSSSSDMDYALVRIVPLK